MAAAAMWSRSSTALPTHFGVVADSDLLACIPSDLLHGPSHKFIARTKLVTLELPFRVEKVLYKLIWHERLNAHPAHEWFRSLVAEVCGVTVRDH
jgi:DNA-binding transcriptional LysR family regulator